MRGILVSMRDAHHAIGCDLLLCQRGLLWRFHVSQAPDDYSVDAAT
jgi:hypothetical protein